MLLSVTCAMLKSLFRNTTRLIHSVAWYVVSGLHIGALHRSVCWLNLK